MHFIIWSSACVSRSFGCLLVGRIQVCVNTMPKRKDISKDLRSNCCCPSIWENFQDTCQFSVAWTYQQVHPVFIPCNTHRSFRKPKSHKHSGVLLCIFEWTYLNKISTSAFSIWTWVHWKQWRRHWRHYVEMYTTMKILLALWTQMSNESGKMKQSEPQVFEKLSLLHLWSRKATKSCFTFFCCLLNINHKNQHHLVLNQYFYC